ncbi:MAG: c-type cytochrome [Acidobacteria bacterium]|nr:c-type cytochrome [Acidobacteriota bacterium]
MRRVAVLLLVFLALGCKREQRQYRQPPPPTPVKDLRLGRLSPGPTPKIVGIRNPYQGNALAISEGKRLFGAYNCVGCHANGGGGMGPPLMDEKWIYGSEPQNIFATIVQGRPNGMPAFGDKIPDTQVWQLVAYVQSLSGNESALATNGRPDQMQVHRQDQSLPELPPRAAPAVHP